MSEEAAREFEKARQEIFRKQYERMKSGLRTLITSVLETEKLEECEIYTPEMLAFIMVDVCRDLYIEYRKKRTEIQKRM